MKIYIMLLTLPFCCTCLTLYIVRRVTVSKNNAKTTNLSTTIFSALSKKSFRICYQLFFFFAARLAKLIDVVKSLFLSNRLWLLQQPSVQFYSLKKLVFIFLDGLSVIYIYNCRGGLILNFFIVF